MNCIDSQCEICPNNQIYSKIAPNCAKTCENYLNFHCDSFSEGCICPEGQVYDNDVMIID